jgi:glycosyltransferase involved in cell wall biosynthesis
MKILHVVPTYYPAVRYGGTIRAVHELARAQAARGHDVHAFTTNVDGPGVSNVPLGVPVNMEGVQVWYFPTGAGRRIYRSPAMGRALKAALPRFDIAHLHSVYLWPTAKAASMARRMGVPYVLTPHGMLAEDLIRRKSAVVKRAWIAMFERRNVNEAAAVHVTANAEGDDLLKLGFKPRHIAVVPNGVEPPPECNPPPAEDKPYILFLGRINWKKGLDRLIPAMRHLPDAELIIAGNDEENYQPQMEALARETGVADRVRFTGPADDAQKWRLIAGARLLALPSYNENFGIVVLEAMAAGCPVVVTPEVGLAPAVRESGAGMVVPGLPAVLAEAMGTLLADAGLRAHMGAAGRKAAQDFSWPVIAQKMDEIYAACSAGKAPQEAAARK